MLELSLRIRDYREDDFSDLHSMDRVCFPDYIAFSRWELAFNLHHPQSITRVAESSGRIVGFVLARMEPGLRLAHIITLDVSPDARNRRIGTMLMEMLHQELAGLGIKSVILEVSVMNYPAQRLYDKLRYRQIGVLPGYYQGREDAYRLRAVVREG